MFPVDPPLPGYISGTFISSLATFAHGQLYGGVCILEGFFFKIFNVVLVAQSEGQGDNALPLILGTFILF